MTVYSGPSIEARHGAIVAFALRAAASRSAEALAEAEITPAEFAKGMKDRRERMAKMKAATIAAKLLGELPLHAFAKA